MEKLTQAIETAEDILSDLLKREPTSAAEEIVLERNIQDARDAAKALRNLKNSSTFIS